MAVYVDNMEAAFGRMKMCHCWADTRAELFAMMNTIGVQLKWFQRPDGDCDFGMNASWEHFDIAQSKRALAVRHGAIEVSMYVMAEHANREKFIKCCARENWRGALSALRYMELAWQSEQRRLADD